MEQYIPKSALLAEIEKLKDDAHNGVLYHQSRQNIGLENELSTWGHLESAFATVLKIINALGVKDVDLETQIEDYINSHFTEGCDGGMISDWYKVLGGVHYKDLVEIAKHFFELGIKEQKGEEV